MRGSRAPIASSATAPDDTSGALVAPRQGAGRCADL